MSQATHSSLALLEKLDRQRTLKFLTGLASVISKHGKLGFTCLDEFRIAIKSLNTTQGDPTKQQTFLLALHEQNSDLLNYCIERFGVIGFSRNLLRHHLINCAEDLKVTSALLGQQILERVNLTLNRPMYIYVGGKAEAITPLSSALIEYSRVIESSCHYLDMSMTLSRDFLSSSITFNRQDEELFEQDIAAELGFSEIKSEAFPYQTEQQSLQLIALGILTLCDGTTQLCNQIGYNMIKNTMAPVLVALDNIRSETTTLMNAPLPDTHNLELWELKKLRLLSTTRSIISDINSLSQFLCEAITTTRNLIEPNDSRMTGVMERSLMVIMMEKGISAYKARMATTALFEYCNAHGVTPGSLIHAELKKISPLFDEQCEFYLQKQEREKSLQLNVDEKEKSLQRAKSMGKSFAEHAVTLGNLVLCFGLLLSGCGLKGNPKSHLDDLRPPVPYHQNSTQSNQETVSPQ